MSLAITNTSPRISRLAARLQAQSSYWLAWVRLVMHMNVNTVDVGYHVKWCAFHLVGMCFSSCRDVLLILSGCAFHLVGCYLNTLMLQLMAGTERLCHFLNGVASLCHIFKWGREIKKVGHHWPIAITQNCVIHNSAHISTFQHNCTHNQIHMRYALSKEIFYRWIINSLFQ